MGDRYVRSVFVSFSDPPSPPVPQGTWKDKLTTLGHYPDTWAKFGPYDSLQGGRAAEGVVQREAAKHDHTVQTVSGYEDGEVFLWVKVLSDSNPNGIANTSGD